jgi:UDP-N-acetylglucosamine:LPS N-acetylglucosamine transferase
MDLVYAASDIVISRAGASSVSELSIVETSDFIRPMLRRIIKRRTQNR